MKARGTDTDTDADFGTLAEQGKGIGMGWSWSWSRSWSWSWVGCWWRIGSGDWVRDWYRGPDRYKEGDSSERDRNLGRAPSPATKSKEGTDGLLDAFDQGEGNAKGARWNRRTQSPRGSGIASERTVKLCKCRCECTEAASVCRVRVRQYPMHTTRRDTIGLDRSGLVWFRLDRTGSVGIEVGWKGSARIEVGWGDVGYHTVEATSRVDGVQVLP